MILNVRLEDGTPNWEAIAAALADPFDPKDINFKPLTTPDPNTHMCPVAAFIDARDVQDRLDQVVGVGGWEFSCEPLHTNSKGEIDIAKGTLTIYGVSKSDFGDCGSNSSTEKTKWSASDCEKRAGVQWGIFRYGYAVQLPKVKMTSQYITEAQKAELRKHFPKPGTAQAKLGPYREDTAASDDEATDPMEVQHLRALSFGFTEEKWQERKKILGTVEKITLALDKTEEIRKTEPPKTKEVLAARAEKNLAEFNRIAKETIPEHTGTGEVDPDPEVTLAEELDLDTMEPVAATQATATTAAPTLGTATATKPQPPKGKGGPALWQQVLALQMQAKLSDADLTKLLENFGQSYVQVIQALKGRLAQMGKQPYDLKDQAALGARKRGA